MRSAPTSTASAMAAMLTVTSSRTTAKDFGNWTTGTVSGTKFEDQNADGAAVKR